MALDANDKLDFGGHCENVCLNYAINGKEFDSRYYLNKIKSDQPFLDKYKKFNYNYFIEQTRKDLDNRDNHLKFNKSEFLKLIDQFKEHPSFKSNLGSGETAVTKEDKKETLKAINNINGSITTKSRHYHYKSRFNQLIDYLESKSINNNFSLPCKLNLGEQIHYELKVVKAIDINKGNL